MDDSAVIADGERGTALAQTERPIGSGGGSGGSVQILATHFDGDGFISVKGGNGSDGGGGGGSGGRVVIIFLGNYLADFQNENTFHWEGTLDLSGGVSGKINQVFQQAGQLHG